MHKIMICVTLLLSSLCGFGETDAFAGFAHKAKIAFTGYAGESTLTNFPALVRLSEGVGGFSYADCKLANGGDVRFTRGDGLELASECAKWDPAGESQFWVRVPELAQGTVIYVCWGNASAAKRDQRLRVWDRSYTGVWSMDDSGIGIADKSDRGNYGTSTSASQGAAGVVGLCRQFDSSQNDYARAGRGYNTSFTTPQTTYECWYKFASLPTAVAPMMAFTVMHGGGANVSRPMRNLQINTKGLPQMKLQDKTVAPDKTAETAKADVWHQAVVTVDDENKTCSVYCDGVLVASANYTNPNGAENANLYPMQFAYAWYSGSGVYANISMDEARVSQVARTADYVEAAYATVASDGFLTIENFDGRAIPTVETRVRQFRFVISSEEGGTVSPSGEVLVNEGESLEVKATASPAGKAFYAWSGDCPTTQVFTASIRLAADRDRTVTARFGTAYYVVCTNADETAASDDNPGRSKSAAKATIKGALSQIDADAATDPSAIPAVVLVGEGTYPLTEPWVEKGKGEYKVQSAIAVRSADGRDKAKIDFGKVEGRRSFYLNSPGAVVDGFQFVNLAEKSKTSDQNYGVAEIANGHLLNCTVDGVENQMYDSGLVMVDAGWICGCRFANGTLKRTQAGKGYGLVKVGQLALMDSCVVTNFTLLLSAVNCSGAIRNCLFADLKTSSKGTYSGGAVICTPNSSQEFYNLVAIDNCTFVGCNATSTGGKGGAIYSSVIGLTTKTSPWPGDFPPVVVNCAFLGNQAVDTASGDDVYNVELFSSLSANADAVNGNIVGVPTFDDKKPGEYLPTGTSLTRNNGAWLNWDGVAGMFDVAGANRFEETALDIGCREYPKPAHEALGVNVQMDVMQGVETLTVSFSTVVTGDATGLAYAWDFGDGATSTETAPIHTYANPGYYTVTLKVQNDAGEEADYTGKDVVKVLPRKCYVRAVGQSTPVEPFDTEAKAANDIKSALALMPEEIDLGEGDIPVGDVLEVKHAVKIAGKGPEKTTITGCGKDSTGRIVYLMISHADAALTGVRFPTVNMSNEPNLTLSAGTVSNCTFRSVKCNTTPVKLSGGTLTHCEFTDCWSDTSGNAGVSIVGPAQMISCVISNATIAKAAGKNGLAIRGVKSSDTPAGEALVRNCLITGVSGTQALNGEVYFDFPVRIENCTIVSNTVPAGSTCAGIELVCGGCEVVNTISWGNLIAGTEETDAVESDLVVADGVTATLSHSCFAGATEPTCTGEDPRFCFGKPASRPFYGIKSSSPCKNTGVKLDWMTDGATDLIGKPRVFGGVPDMGCYESQTGGLVIMLW